MLQTCTCTRSLLWKFTTRDVFGHSNQRLSENVERRRLGSLPGTAAEVLDDGETRNLSRQAQFRRVVICGEKCPPGWHKNDINYYVRHVDSERTFLEQASPRPSRTTSRNERHHRVVPLPFVHFKAPIYEKGRARKGPTMRECVLMHAVGRLVLGPIGIKNIQRRVGENGAIFASNLLFAGCNDVGGVLMNESITRAAGSTFGQEFNVVEMEALIIEPNGVPRLRNTCTRPRTRTKDGRHQRHKSVVVNFTGGGKQQVEE